MHYPIQSQIKTIDVEWAIVREQERKEKKKIDREWWWQTMGESKMVS